MYTKVGGKFINWHPRPRYVRHRPSRFVQRGPVLQAARGLGAEFAVSYGEESTFKDPKTYLLVGAGAALGVIGVMLFKSR